VKWAHDPAREAAWQAEKERLYAKWREEKMQAGLNHLGSVMDDARRREILAAVDRKYGKRFAEDLRKRFYGGAA